MGCGISLDVRALAAAGTRSVGLDISKVAVEYSRKFEGFEEHASAHLEPSDRRGGGSAEWLVGDLLNMEWKP